MSQPGQCPICALGRGGEDTASQVIYEDDFWVVRHSKETNILGYVVLASRRHFLDLSEATDAETGSYGKVLGTTMRAVRRVTSCQRVYTFSLGEAVPHFHVHIIPRTASLPRAYRGRGIMSYPVVPPADPALLAETSDRLRRVIARYHS